MNYAELVILARTYLIQAWPYLAQAAGASFFFVKPLLKVIALLLAESLKTIQGLSSIYLAALTEHRLPVTVLSVAAILVFGPAVFASLLIMITFFVSLVLMSILVLFAAVVGAVLISPLLFGFTALCFAIWFATIILSIIAKDPATFKQLIPARRALVPPARNPQLALSSGSEHVPPPAEIPQNNDSDDLAVTSQPLSSPASVSAPELDTTPARGLSV